jgi:hypothetical protein
MHSADWYRGNVVDLCPESAWFEFQLGRKLFSPQGVGVFRLRNVNIVGFY